MKPRRQGRGFDFGLRWQAKRDTALARKGSVDLKPKRRRRCALPALRSVGEESEPAPKSSVPIPRPDRRGLASKHFGQTFPSPGGRSDNSPSSLPGMESPLNKSRRDG